MSTNMYAMFHVTDFNSYQRDFVFVLFSIYVVEMVSISIILKSIFHSKKKLILKIVNWWVIIRFSENFSLFSNRNIIKKKTQFLQRPLYTARKTFSCLTQIFIINRNAITCILIKLYRDFLVIFCLHRTVHLKNNKRINQ